MTSHDVVGRVRKAAKTRRVGHAGTLDPMATGVLVVGVDRATRLLGYLVGGEKTYEATICLGAVTDTDDASGVVLDRADTAAVTEAAVAAGVAALTGEIVQTPPRISAVKVAGERAHRRARAGEQVELTPRNVTVTQFDLGPLRRTEDGLEFEAVVTCSAGTYVRALARDLGVALGVGGHLSRLRRIRSGVFDISACRSLQSLEAELLMVPLGEAAAMAFPRCDLDRVSARIVTNGGWIPAAEGAPAGPVAAFGPSGEFLALLGNRGDRTWPLAVFVEPVISGAGQGG